MPRAHEQPRGARDAKLYESERQSRGQILLSHISGCATTLWGAHASMAVGDRERAEEIVTQNLPESLGSFGTLSVSWLGARWGSELTDRANDLVRQALTTTVHHRGNTENHWLVYYSGTLVATEQYADVEIWWNGMPRVAVQAEARRWILGMIDRTARLGHHEYDSPQYHACHMLAMIFLADHAQDPQVQRQAEQMATLFVADMALEYFHGAWAGGHSREGYRQNTWTITGIAASMAYYYFGDVEFDEESHGWDMAGPAISARYQPPQALAEMALDRSQPFVVRKTKAPREIYRQADGVAQPVRKYTYVSPSFALGSTQIGLPGPEAGPIDLVSWDLTWAGPQHQAKIVCNHPYLSPGRFSAFLSELPQAIGRSVAEAHKPYLQNPDRLFGASPFEQMVQCESAVLVAYRIPPEDRAPYVSLYLPKQVAWVEERDWLLGDAGGFYIAIRTFCRYRWLEIVEESQIDGWMLRMDGPAPGLALEAEEADAVGSFDEFCDEMVGPRLDLGDWLESGRVAFDTRRGGRLELTYDGPHHIDGQEVDYEAWPLYCGLGVEGKMNTGRIALRHSGEEIDLDFGVDPDGPMLPMRVIG